MDKTNFDMAVMVGKYLGGTLSEEERGRLERWLAAEGRNREWFERVTAEGYREQKLEEASTIRVEEGWRSLEAKRAVRRGRRVWRTSWMRYAALLVLPLMGAWLLYQYGGRGEDNASTRQSIAPGENKAKLILADGSSVVLERQGEKVLKEADGTRINVLKERIMYENTLPAGREEGVYHELVIPRGGEFSLTLSDGTVVYMNADSKLRFPTRFGAGERVVELEGEAYFQVARDEASPFIVKSSRVAIRVLGTEFNVSAYAEDSVMRTTLVRGAVKISSEVSGESVVLHPGEQAALCRDNHALRVSEVDVSYAVAWKEGRLRFREKRLEEVMRIVARWYDVEVVFEDEEVKGYPFGCNFSRHATIEPLLKVFEATGTIETSVQGRKIWIRKKD